MMSPSFVRWAGRHLWPYTKWDLQKRWYRSNPVRRDLDAKEAVERKQHHRVRPLQRQRQAIVNADLRRSVH